MRSFKHDAHSSKYAQYGRSCQIRAVLHQVGLEKSKQRSTHGQITKDKQQERLPRRPCRHANGYEISIRHHEHKTQCGNTTHDAKPTRRRALRLGNHQIDQQNNAQGDRPVRLLSNHGARLRERDEQTLGTTQMQRQTRQTHGQKHQAHQREQPRLLSVFAHWKSSTHHIRAGSYTGQCRKQKQRKLRNHCNTSLSASVPKIGKRSRATPFPSGLTPNRF